MSSFWDDLPRVAPICLIVFFGVVIILVGFIFQRFLPTAGSAVFVLMVLLFSISLCIFGIRQGALD